MTYTVSVTRRGRGKYLGGDYTISSLTFTDEKKAREHYTDMLMMYPSYKIELIPTRNEDI